MRFIKLGLISIVVFSLLITAISLLIPSRYRLTRTVDIITEKDSLLQQLSIVTNWPSWYPGLDSILKNDKTFSISAVGFYSETVSTRITNVTDSSVIAVSFRNNKEFTNGWLIFPGMRPNSLTVQWYMNFRLRWYPWEKFSSLMFDRRYGNPMEQGLENLKLLLEK